MLSFYVYLTFNPNIVGECVIMFIKFECMSLYSFEGRWVAEETRTILHVRSFHSSCQVSMLSMHSDTAQWHLKPLLEAVMVHESVRSARKKKSNNRSCKPMHVFLGSSLEGGKLLLRIPPWWNPTNRTGGQHAPSMGHYVTLCSIKLAASFSCGGLAGRGAAV
jgi:hypothetical protein